MENGHKWSVESESRPGVFYDVELHVEDRGALKAGAFTCSCMAWRFQKKPVSERICKHVIWVQGQMRDRDEFHVIKEIRGSEIDFSNGRIAGLLEAMNL
jgi:hypothetical protein